MYSDHGRTICSVPIWLLLVSSIVAAPSVAIAQSVPILEPTGVVAPEPREPSGAQLFGFYFDADDGRALLALTAAPDPGRVLAFTRGLAGEWLPDGTLPNPNPMSSDGFGTGVALDGNFALVSSREQGGSFHLFRFTTAGWVQVQRIANPAGPDSGVNPLIRLTNGIAAIGGQGADGSGRVFTYRVQRNRLRPMEVLRASDASVGDNFGMRVALSPTGKTLVVMAGRPENEWTGSVYVFRRHGKRWVEQQKLEIGLPTALFGDGLATTDGLLIVGASGEDGGSGAAYVFRRAHGEWLLQQRVRPGQELPGGASMFAFGNDIAIGSNRVVIGAHFSTPALAFGYRLSEAGLTSEFATQGPTFLAEYVDIEENTVMISSPLEALVYLYELGE